MPPLAGSDWSSRAKNWRTSTGKCATIHISVRCFSMDPKTHWEKVYTTNALNEVSWYQPHLETSLALIRRAGGANSAAIIDVGGGESTLVDDLLARGYQNISILDISQTAIDATKQRLKELAERVQWIAGDVTKLELPPGTYDVWHDR